MKILISVPNINSMGGAEKYALDLANYYISSGENDVYLASADTKNLDEIGRYYNLDLSSVKGVNFYYPSLPLLDRFPKLLYNFVFDYFRKRQFYKLDLDLFVECGYRWETPAVANTNYYICHFPHRLDIDFKSLFHKIYWNFNQFIRKIFLYKGKNFFETYDAVVSNSEYTKSYIKERWGVDSFTIEPSCVTHDSRRNDIVREEKIISVGRFEKPQKGVPHKGQHHLIKIFSELTDLHDKGWELHLIGSLGESGDEYIKQLRKSALGLPIFVHPNLSFEEKEELTKRSSIYWHAQGYGTDPEKSPQAQEHFGITTVEAMNAGLLPVVIGRAGPLEVAGELGLTWNSLAELKEITRKIADLSEKDLALLRKQAKKISEKYTYNQFCKKFQELDSKYLTQENRSQ